MFVTSSHRPICLQTIVLRGRTVKEQLMSADSNNARDCTRLWCANLFDSQVKTRGIRVTLQKGQMIASETFRRSSFTLKLVKGKECVRRGVILHHCPSGNLIMFARLCMQERVSLRAGWERWPFKIISSPRQKDTMFDPCTLFSMTLKSPRGGSGELNDVV